MTRLWGLPPEYLCDSHLLGEHSELHQEGGTLVNHPHGKAVCYGHAKLGQVRTGLLAERHEVLVREMKCRGMNHDSPFDYKIDFDIGYIDRHANLVDLYQRCEDCAERIERLGGFA